MDPFARHYGLWSPADQRRISETQVAVAGIGGVGASQALFLAKAGFGQIRVGDRDSYEIENIVEQAFATWDRLGQRKVDVAAHEMRRHQREVTVKTFHGDLTDERLANELVSESKLVFSGVDNPAARISLGRAALSHNVPFVVGANIGWTVFHTIYLPSAGGYAAAFAATKGILKDADGFPRLDDDTTRERIEREWCIWTLALSGFRKSELRQFASSRLDHYSYAAPPAFVAGSLTVVDGIKWLLGLGETAVFPDLRVLDLRSGCYLSPTTVCRRYQAVSKVWGCGEKALFDVINRF